MYCVSCGKELEPGMKFCPSCGAVADWSTQAGAPGNAGTAPPPPPRATYTGSTRPPRTAQLLRPREGRVIAGVCAAFALHYGWDVMVVRVLTVVLAFVTVVGVFGYLIAWIVIPEAPFPMPTSSR